MTLSAWTTYPNPWLLPQEWVAFLPQVSTGSYQSPTSNLKFYVLTPLSSSSNFCQWSSSKWSITTTSKAKCFHYNLLVSSLSASSWSVSWSKYLCSFTWSYPKIEEHRHHQKRARTNGTQSTTCWAWRYCLFWQFSCSLASAWCLKDHASIRIKHLSMLSVRTALTKVVWTVQRT